tara:strand:+ start:229 stop:540 length:312 start_codon:yes stop_codon:yes gene_type:complete
MLNTKADANSTSTVSPTDAIPVNCHTIIIYNPDTTNNLYIAEGTADPAVALSDDSSLVLAPNSSVSLSIGVQSTRVDPLSQFVYSTSAGSIKANISYLCTNVL